jgi:hypothetical protein
MNQRFQYNGIDIALPRVAIAVRPTYDGTDRILQGYALVFRVQGLLIYSVDFTDSASGPTGGGDGSGNTLVGGEVGDSVAGVRNRMAINLASMQRALAVPRRRLLYFFDNSTPGSNYRPAMNPNIIPGNFGGQSNISVAAAADLGRPFAFPGSNDRSTFWDISGDPNDVGSRNSNGSTPDRRWGPKPRILAVESIPGGSSARITFEVECFISPLADGDKATPAYFEELWIGSTFAYDRNFHVTRTTKVMAKVNRWAGQWREGGSAVDPVTGKAASPPEADPDNMRSNSARWLSQAFFTDTARFIPPPFKYGKRVSGDVSTSPDGMSLEATVTDVQVYRTLPRPLTDGTANFSLTLSTSGAQPVAVKSLTCDFTQPPDFPVDIIYQFITALIYYRFPEFFPGPGKAAQGFFTQLTIGHPEFENRVTAQITGMTTKLGQLLLPTPDPNNPNGPVTLTSAVLQNALGMDDINKLLPHFGHLWQRSDGWSWLPANGMGPPQPTPDPAWNDPNTVNNVVTPGSLGTGGMGAESSAILIARDTPQTPEMVKEAPSYDPLYVQDEQGDPNNGVPPVANPVYDTDPAAPPPNPVANPNLSDAGTSNFYTHYSDHIQYQADRGLRVLSSTVAGGVDVIQQVHQPVVRVIHVGSARRIGLPVEAPPTMGVTDSSPPDSNVDQDYFKQGQPRLCLDGKTLEFSATWSYSSILPNTRGISSDAGKPANYTFAALPKNPALDYESPDFTASGSELAKATGGNTGFNSDGSAQA